MKNVTTTPCIKTDRKDNTDVQMYVYTSTCNGTIFLMT